MAKMTKAQARRLHDLQMTVFAMADRVFSAVDRSDVPFSDCLKAATHDVREKHAAALSALQAYESELIAKGCGYRDQWGHFKGNT